LNGRGSIEKIVKNPAIIKQFFKLFLPSLFILLAIVFSSVYPDIKNRLATLEAREVEQIGLSSSNITVEFESITADLKLLANNLSLKRYLDSDGEANRADVVQTFLDWAREKQIYDQVRYLDASGMETFRINLEKGSPLNVTGNALQNKAGRYFFKDTIKLGRGEIFVSPLDLNIEHDQIEQPYKPMIRFGTPVFDSAGRKRGIVLLNYFGNRMLHNFKKFSAIDQDAMVLLNRDGYWLSAPKAEDEWGFMFKSQRSFANRFPDEWKAITSGERGNLRTPRGLFVYATVYPLLPQLRSSTGSPLPTGSSEKELLRGEYFWKIVSYTPPELLPSASLKQYPVFFSLFLGAIVLIAFGSGYLANSLVKREQDQKTLVEIGIALGEGLYVLNEKGRIIFSNPALSRLLGWTHGELNGQNAHALFHHHKLDGTPCTEESCEIGKVIRSGEMYRSDNETFWCKVGTPLPVSVISSPIVEQGKVVGSVVTFQDITQRKFYEEELLRDNEQLDAILNAITESIILLDHENIVLVINPTAAHRLGKEPGEIIGRNVFDFIPPDVAQSREATIAGVINSGKSRHVEDNRAGHVFSIFYYPALDEEGRSKAVAVFALDIAERKRAEDALKALNETLERRVREGVSKNMEQERLLIQQSRMAAMGEMIGNIAHQWRQPLNALGLLLANIKDANDFHELDTAMVNDQTTKGQLLIQKMSTTIDDFRNFFKPNKIRQDFSLIKSIEDTIQLVSQSFRNHNITVMVKECEDIQASGFPNELSQVFLNILSNAKDAMLERNIQNGKIEISLHHSGNIVEIVVRDNAGGIPNDILPKIFDPYFTTKEKGTGIGLYMSKMIMGHMDGNIEANNTDEGAEFVVSIPLATNS
jgi:PAS domain S-box-containing protein